MEVERTNAFAYIGGHIVPVSSVSIQINDESELQIDAIAKLAPTSIAYLPGWEKAWQKKNDGTWKSMTGGDTDD